MLKELHNKLTKESEQIKQEKAEQRQRKVISLVTFVTTFLIKSQDAILNELSVLSDAVSSTRSRIVQSPERIKRNIVTMSATALEDKKIVSANEVKTRDLQAKINILFQVEKVCSFLTPVTHHGHVWPRMFAPVQKPSKLYKKRKRRWRLR